MRLKSAVAILFSYVACTSTLHARTPPSPHDDFVTQFNKAIGQYDELDISADRAQWHGREISSRLPGIVATMVRPAKFGGAIPILRILCSLPDDAEKTEVSATYSLETVNGFYASLMESAYVYPGANNTTHIARATAFKDERIAYSRHGVTGESETTTALVNGFEERARLEGDEIASDIRPHTKNSGLKDDVLYAHNVALDLNFRSLLDSERAAIPSKTFLPKSYLARTLTTADAYNTFIDYEKPVFAPHIILASGHSLSQAAGVLDPVLSPPLAKMELLLARGTAGVCQTLLSGAHPRAAFSGWAAVDSVYGFYKVHYQLGEIQLGDNFKEMPRWENLAFFPSPPQEQAKNISKIRSLEGAERTLKPAGSSHSRRQTSLALGN